MSHLCRTSLHPPESAHGNAFVTRPPNYDSPDRSGFINLENNEMRHPVVEGWTEETKSTLQDKDLGSYPSLDEACGRLATYFHVRKENLMLSPGSDSIIRLVIETFGRAASQIILQSPNYHGYQRYLSLNGLTARHVTFSDATNGTYDLQTFLTLAQADSSSSLFCLTNPSPFSGACLALAAMQQLVDVCDRQGHLLIIDEAYAPYNGFFHTALLKSPCVFLIRSLSKSFGLAGARLAALLADEKKINYLLQWSLQRSVSGLSLRCLSRVLEQTGRLESAQKQIIEIRDGLRRRLLAKGWNLLDSQANFLTVRLASAADAASFVTFMRNRGVLVRDLSTFAGMLGYIRFAVPHPAQIDKIEELLDEFQVIRAIEREAE